MQVIVERPAALELHEVLGRTAFEVLTPVGKGTEITEGLAQSISNAFEKFYSINNQGLPIGIERIERAPGRYIDAEWWSVPVYIYWRAYSTATSPFQVAS